MQRVGHIRRDRSVPDVGRIEGASEEADARPLGRVVRQEVVPLPRSSAASGESG